MMRVGRRQLLQVGSATGLMLLGGCDDDGGSVARTTFRGLSTFNDMVQGLLFNPSRLAPTYPASEVTTPFPYRGYYPEANVPVLDGGVWQLALAGRVAEKKPWTLARLRALPQVTQVTRMISAGGASAIGRWSGVPLRTLLERSGADLSARYVGIECADGYYEGLDMASALHPQSLLALRLGDADLPARHGFPVRVITPVKLGYKCAKFVTALWVTDMQPRGYWPDRGFNWFAGL